MEIVLKLYTYVDGVNDTPFPNNKEQAMFTFTYEANRMAGSPTITAKVKHRLCLDDLWTDNVYAMFNGVRYYIMNTPSSSKDNEDARYEHDLELMSEREILNHVYFIDAVQGDSSVDQPKSNTAKVQFFGDVNEFAGRLNACFQYQNLNYTAVVDEGVESEDKQVSFEDKYILEALQEIYNVYEIPYYFVGNVVHIGYSENTVTYPLKYGFDEALLSISKDNANYALINKIKGQGSSDNIPYYYPNNSPKGDIGIRIISGSMVVSNFIIYDYEKFASSMSTTDTCTVRQVTGESGVISFVWSMNGKDIELSDIGIRLAYGAVPKAGSSFGQRIESYITPSDRLMPSIYRETKGAEQFYEAKNNTYEDGEGGYYEFENEYSEKNPRQGTTNFEDIKPTIKEMTNASGQRIDMFTAFAYDLNDNDEVDEEGKYIHPYFFAKLRKFDGSNGFNLFDQAIEGQTMTISFTSGACGACSFEIGVGEETEKNIVQVDDNGNLKRDSNGNVLWENQTPQGRQNDTSKYEVWIALKKDDSTYSYVMPNVTQNIKPSTDDTFVILGINLPTSYITAAEKRLEQSLIKYMWMNNTEKFTFSIKFSRIFFTEHPEVLEQLNENSRVLVEYNGQQHTLYVDSFTYRTDESSPLPEITVDLVDTLSIGQNSLQTQLDSVKQDILSSVGGGDFLKQGLKYFIRKDIADTAQGKITFNSGLQSKGDVIIGKNGFAGGLAGFGAKIGSDGRAEMRSLTLWEFLEVPELRFNSVKVFLGIDWQVAGAGIIESCTPDTDAEGNELTTGTCTLKLEEGQYGAVDVDDIALGIWHFGNSNDATEDSDDGKGNFTFAGFATSYFRITEVSGTNNETFKYSLRPGFKIHPQSQMTFACYGNFTNGERQTSTYRTRTYTRRLWKQNTWEIGEQNIAMQDGDLSNLSIFGLDMTGYSMYVNSVYFTGTVSQIAPDGTPVMTANDRGAWQSGTTYNYYDRVSHDGSIWLCVNENGTNTEPSESNPDWLLQVSKGETGQDGTSFKILGSKDDESQLPQEGNQVGDAYLINGDMWVWTEEGLWKNVGNIQGPAGSSVTPLGNWYSGMEVPYLGVVRMGTSTFMCTNEKGTTNPPLWCWTDNSTNRFIYNDNGYALTGEVNGEDYIIIAEDGTNAVSIIKVDVEYSITTSNTTAPTTGWQTDAPQWKNGEYIWSRTVTYYSDGTITYTDAACISGGKGIRKITEYYYRSTSATELVGGEWSTTCPEWINGTYIWTKSVIEYTDNTSEETDNINSTGAKGESSVIADIDNEMDSVALDYNGLTTEATTITSNISVWMGYDKIPISSISVSKPKNINVTYDTSTGKISASINKGVSLSDVSRIEISVTATYQGQTYTRNLTLSILAVKAGSPGDNATLYRLVPSASSIVKKKDGSYSVSSVSCNRTKTIGDNTSTTTDGELKYSIDGYTEQTAQNGQGIQPSSINSYITFLFYVDGAVVDKETVPLIVDGVDGADGEGYTNMGYWKTDMLVPKLGVVSMGGSSWTAKKATRNPPLWCWTDKDGNRFIYSDGYYSLTGEQNNSEYDLLAEKGDTGEDGKDGSDGEDGKDGKDGKGYEYIFKRTTTDSRPSTPATSQTDDYVPSGWTDDPQGVSMTYLYEWVSQRTKTNGTWSSFSTPSIWAKYGETGKTGETGALARYRGVYNSSDTYIYDYENNVLVRDIVVYNGQAYQVKTRGDSVTGVTPSSTSSRWEQGSKFSFVATDTALIDNANVAGFIFRNLGFGSDGTPYGELRSQNTDSTGSPTLYMNTKTGYFYCSNATIQGALKAGSVGDFTINKGISNVEDNPEAFIEIEKNGGKYFRVNKGTEDAMCSVRADSAKAVKIQTYGSSSSSIGLDISANSRGYGYAIRSYGNVLLDARQSEHVELYGLAINVRKVSSSGSLYSNDDFIEFNNTSSITFNMTSNAVKGKVVYLKKITSGADVTLTGSFRNPGDVGTSTSGRIGDEVSRMFVFDGTYWVQFYCG